MQLVLAFLLPWFIGTTMAQTRPSALASPIFFISLTDKCGFGNAELDPGSNFEAKGSLCAYGKEADIVYSCPAGDP
jgi:hypothetical protein